MFVFIGVLVTAYGVATVAGVGCTKTCTSPLVLYETTCVCLMKYEKASCERGDDDNTACQRIIDLGLCNTISYRASCATGCGLCVADHIPVTNPQVVLRPPKNSVENLYATDCGDPPAIANGYVDFSSTLFTSIARHTCGFGFKLQGHGLSKCMKNGWSDHNSQCVDCYVLQEGLGFYNGTLAVTISGHECQRWDSQSPHSHSYGTEASDFITGETMASVSNYCRAPISDGTHAPWCYTTSSVRWQFCDIPEC